jgi:hypothetical protein
VAIGKTPQNQLDALPLQDADTVAEGGTLQVIGGALYRYFNATQLGIAGIPMATFTGEQALVTPYLDLRGCINGTLALRTVNNVSGRAALPAIFLFVQYRLGPSDTPPVYYANNGGAGSRDEQDNAMAPVQSTGLVFAITAAAGEQQTLFWTWGPGATAGQGNVFGVVGSDCRFIITTQTLGMSTNNVFSANLWASS